VGCSTLRQPGSCPGGCEWQFAAWLPAFGFQDFNSRLTAGVTEGRWVLEVCSREVLMISIKHLCLPRARCSMRYALMSAYAGMTENE
jgi:hypothetical protein